MVLSIGYTHRADTPQSRAAKRRGSRPIHTSRSSDRTDQRPRGDGLQSESRSARQRGHPVEQRGSARSNYNGVDVTVNRRMSSGWSLMAGASFGRSIGDVLGGDLNNPNSNEFRRGLARQRRPWSYRLSGVYDLPYNIATMSGTMQYYKGVPESTTVHGRQQARCPAASRRSSQSVVVEERGTVRLPNVFSLDISLRKPIRRGGVVVRAAARFLQSDERSDDHQLVDDAGVDVSSSQHDPGGKDDQGGV